MDLRNLLNSLFALFKRENPINRRFIFWCSVTFIAAVMAIVAIQVVPMIQETVRLNREIQEGKLYVRGQNAMLNPSVGDFILPDNGDFQLRKMHPARSPKDLWSIGEMERYWDDIDEKTLEQLRQENHKILQDQLQGLP